MTLEERMHVTELARAHWQGTIINNVSTTAVLDAMKLLAHSREPVATSQVWPPSVQQQPHRVGRCMDLLPGEYAQCSSFLLTWWHGLAIVAHSLA